MSEVGPGRGDPSGGKGHDLSRWLPITVGVGLAIAALLSGWALLRHQATSIGGLVRSYAEIHGHNLEQSVETRIRALERMARRWESIQQHAGRDLLRTEWERDAALYLRHHAGLVAVQWVDSAQRLRWSVQDPTEGPESVDPTATPEGLAALAAAADRGSTALSGPIDSIGRQAFIVAIPLYPGDRFEGFLVGVHLYAPVLATAFEHLAEHDLTAQIRVAGTAVGSTGVRARPGPANSFYHHVVVRLPGSEWQLSVAPTPEFLARHRTDIPITVFLLGLVIAGLGAGGVWLASKLIERQTQHARELRVMLEATPDAMILVDEETRLIQINHRVEELFGYTREEVLGRTGLLFAPPEDRQRLRRIWKRYLRDPQPLHPSSSLDLRGQRRDGTVFVADMSLGPLETSDGLRVFAAIRDVSERRSAEERLKDSEARYRAFFDHVPDGAFRTTPEGELLAANRALLDMLGYDSLAEARRSPVTAHYVDPASRQAWQEKLEERGVVTGYPIDLVRKDGEILSVRGSSRIVREDGVLYYEGILQDVTEQRRAEARLEENERRLAEAQRIGGFGSWDWDLRDDELVLSDQLLRILGFSPDRFEGSIEEFFDIVHPEDVERVRASSERAIEENRPFDVEFRIHRADGETRIVHGQGEPVTNDRGEVVRLLGTGHDISEQRRLEEQLRQSQKMEAIGLLAGGVAHDFNNLLTAVVGYCDLAGQKLDPDDTVAHDLREIRRAAERAVTLTRQLLAFSRQQIMSPRRVDLNEVVRRIEDLIRNSIGERIELDLDLAGDLEPVRVDPGQIEQVLLNLVLNARDAMRDGGCLTLRTRNLELATPLRCQRFTVEAGSWVELSVEDTGTGMEESVRRQAVEPFFTTKGPAEGTGLGLSTAYGIVKQSRGLLLIDSEPGEGTRVRVLLPRVGSRLDEAQEELTDRPGESARQSELSGEETILLVEDEDLVRDLLSATLRDCGFEVLTAATPGEALRIATRSAEEIDLLVTDVVLPGISGVDLAEKLRSELPELKVLFMSGYASEEIRREGLLREEDNVLAKPFSPSDLVHQVRRSLDGPARTEARRGHE